MKPPAAQPDETTCSICGASLTPGRPGSSGAQVEDHSASVEASVEACGESSMTITDEMISAGLRVYFDREGNVLEDCEGLVRELFLAMNRTRTASNAEVGQSSASPPAP